MIRNLGQGLCLHCMSIYYLTCWGVKVSFLAIYFISFPFLFKQFKEKKLVLQTLCKTSSFQKFQYFL